MCCSVFLKQIFSQWLCRSLVHVCPSVSLLAPGAPKSAAASLDVSSCLAMTFSNCDQRPSTWPNSLPTCVCMSHLVNSHRSQTYRNDSLETSVELVHVLKDVFKVLPIWSVKSGNTYRESICTIATSLTNTWRCCSKYDSSA